MITTVFYPFLGFCLVLLILYLFKPNPEYPLIAWVCASSFAMLSLMLFTTGLSYPSGYSSTSTEWLNMTTNITHQNIEQIPTLITIHSLIKNSLALMFIILAVYLAISSFTIKKKKNTNEYEEAM